jgi:penicillin-binding protein 2
MGILENNSDFCKKIYEILIYDGEISGRELCLALYEQGVLEWNDSDVEKLKNSTPSAVYSFILDKIGNLELTPAQLALTPCSGSVVITDVETGEVRALVSYPSYDINRLSGSVDATYYSQLLNDQSTPLYATATQVLRAPGSVFKMISAAAGLEEGVIGEYEQINDTGTYYQFDQQFKLKCWYTAGHGLLDVRGGLTNSCNYFFCEVGYRLSLDEDGNYSSALGLSKLAKYASMFGLDSKSGIEIYESQPSISDENPIPSAIGQGTNTFANIQLNRYVTAIATRGNVYDLTLIQKVTSSVGDTLEEHTPEIVSTVDLKESTWNALWEGMYGVVTQSSVKEAFEDCATSLAGKTGTAQEDTSKPNHARFIGFAPYEDPEIAISVTIPFGYTGTNAAILADEILNYYYGSTTLDEILNAGEAVEAYDGSQRD